MAVELQEDMAQTCAVLRDTRHPCVGIRVRGLEQASLLRELSSHPAVIKPVGIAERTLCQSLYVRRPHLHHSTQGVPD